jgi:hypothetical protein
MQYSIWKAGLAAGTAAVIMSGAGAEAQSGRFELRSDNMITRFDPLAPDEEGRDALGAPFDLETGFDSNTWLRRVQPAAGRQVWRFEQQVRGRVHFDRSELDSLLLTPRIQYWNTTADNRLQFRIYGALSHLRRDGSARWTRPESEAQLRFRPSGDRRLETVARVRVNHYSFTGGAPAGLDSTRVRFGVEQFFRPHEERLEVRLSAFYETANADEKRFSFDEVRFSAEAAWRVDEKTTFAVLADYRDRNYDGVFSAAFPVRRSDERFLAQARVERAISRRITAFASGGYLDNKSNIPLRDYGGGVFQAGFRISL